MADTDETKVNLFDETTLKNVISSAILMSSIDGEIHEKEWDVINSFAKIHWKDEYQNIEQYKADIKKEIINVLNENAKLKKKLNELVEQLTGHLNSVQKNIALNLVGDVMVADNVMTLEESKLFFTFMEKLGIRLY